MWNYIACTYIAEVILAQNTIILYSAHDTDVGYKNYVMKYDFWIEKYKIGPISATEL